MNQPGGSLLLRSVEVEGRTLDCRVVDGRVVDLAPDLARRPGEHTREGRGGALVPGLADHHVHLAATAAHAASLDVSDLDGRRASAALGHASPDRQGWVRVVGWDDETHGPLDRSVLDAYRAGPTRVQHRSGATWVLNSAGLARLGADLRHPGVERDDLGRPTGRLWRADDWLRTRIGGPPPDLTEVGRRLASYGVTHVSDASPHGPVPLLLDAVEDRRLPQHLMVMAADRPTGDHPRVSTGPRKIVVADHALPDLDDLAATVAAAHGEGRPVAVHCVTRTALALTIAALDQAGHVEGDRVEHCAVADAAAAMALAERRVRVVTQPTLVVRRGDTYLARSDPSDRVDLWPLARLLDAGVRVATSSDAPYGDLDPWACLRAAAARTTAGGVVLGPDERISTARALTSRLAALHDPGGAPRRVLRGAPADLVLLDAPLREVLRAPDASRVRLTLVDGAIVHESS